MTTRTKIIVASLVAVLIVGSTAAWSVYTVARWARDLPNRVSMNGGLLIDDEVLSEAVTAAMVESYRVALTSGDADVQKQVLQQFSSYADDHPDAREWLRAEYMSELDALMSSADSEISELAENLIDRLATDAEVPTQPTENR